MRSSYAREQEQIVLFVGRMVREKGVQVLLDAAPRILSERPGTQFLLVGTGYYLEDLKKQAWQMGIGENVHFLGYVGDTELLQLYKIADAVCIPSLYEPFGIVALEGMAAKVPVVTSDVGGLKDFVENGVTGVTTYAGDPASLAWGLLQVLRNPELAQRLRETGYDKVKHIYNWKVIASRTYEVYSKVLSEASMLSSAAEAESSSSSNSSSSSSSSSDEAKPKKAAAKAQAEAPEPAMVAPAPAAAKKPKGKSK